MFQLKQRLSEESTEGGDLGNSSAPESNVEVHANWRDSLPPDLKDNPSLVNVPDVGTLAKQYVDTKAYVGNSFRIPTDEAGSEAWDKFYNRILSNPNVNLMKKPDTDDVEGLNDIYNRLGRPEDVSGYEAPEGSNAEMFGAMASVAHELGLSKRQYEALAAAQAKIGNEYQAQQEQERSNGIAQLRGEWGQAFDEKSERVGKVVKALGGHPMLEDALANGMVDAHTLRLLDNVATQLGTEGSQMASQIGTVTHETVDELKQRRNEITQRLINENLSPTQRQDLINRNIQISEQLSAIG